LLLISWKVVSFELFDEMLEVLLLLFSRPISNNRPNIYHGWIIQKAQSDQTFQITVRRHLAGHGVGGWAGIILETLDGTTQQQG